MGVFSAKLQKLFCFKGNYALYLIFLIVFAGGAVLGIIFSSLGETEIFAVFSTDYFLVIFSKDPLWKIFFSRCINNLALTVILSLVFLTPFLIPLNFVAIIYRGYLFGVCLITVCTLYGVAGALLAIFVIIPCQFILHFIFIGISVNCFGFNKCEKIGRKILPIILWFYLLTIATAVLEMLTVVVFIRPLFFIL